MSGEFNIQGRDEEFVSTDAGDGILGARHFFQSFRHLLEEQSHLFSAASGRGQRLGNPVLQKSSVRQARERIVIREILNLFLLHSCAR